MMRKAPQMETQAQVKQNSKVKIIRLRKKKEKNIQGQKFASQNNTAVVRENIHTHKHTQVENTRLNFIQNITFRFVAKYNIKIYKTQKDVFIIHC